jgi:integrase
MSRRRGAGSIYRQPHCTTWTIQFFRNGKRIRESTGEHRYAVARQILNQRLGAVAKGIYIERDRNPVLVSELYGWLQQRYIENRCKSSAALRHRWAHIEPVFADWQAQNVSTEMIDRYIAGRLAEGARNGTVNREIAVLKAAFRIGFTKRRLSRLPHFKHLKEANARQGFLEDGDYAKLTANASQLWLRLFLELDFTYGWRKSELLALRVNQCDLISRTIRLEADQSKNQEARQVVMTAAVYELVSQAVIGKGQDDFLLTREGNKPVRDFRRSWRTLCIKAGLGRMTCRACGKTMTTSACECGSKLRPRYVGRIVHDFRRSAARQLRSAGVAESVIMKVGGWRTASIFRRYAIVSDADQRQAVEMLEQRRRETAAQANALEPPHEIATEPAHGVN